MVALCVLTGVMAAPVCAQIWRNPGRHQQVRMVAMKNRLMAVLLLTMAIGAVGAPAAGEDSKRVLVLRTYGYDALGRIPFDTALVRALRDVAGVKAELYIETLDPNRFPGEAHARRMREYLREKYVGKKIAVLIAAFDEALSFLLDERDPVFPDVPIAAVLTRYPQTTDDRVAVVWSGNVFGESLTLALRLHPAVRQIAIINGARRRGGGRDPVGEEAQSQIDAIGVGIPVISLRNLPLDELLDRVQALPPETIIFFARQYMGRRGEPIAHDDALRKWCASPARRSTSAPTSSSAWARLVDRDESRTKRETWPTWCSGSPERNRCASRQSRARCCRSSTGVSSGDGASTKRSCRRTA